MKKSYLLLFSLLLCGACVAQNTTSRVVFFRMDGAVNEHTSSLAERRLYTDKIIRSEIELTGIRACNVFVYDDTDISGTYYLKPYVTPQSHLHNVATISCGSGTIVFIKFQLSSSTPIISGAEVVELDDFITCYQKNKWLRKELSKAGYKSVGQLVEGFSEYNENAASVKYFKLNDTVWYSSDGHKAVLRDSAYSYSIVTEDSGETYKYLKYYADNNSLMEEGQLSSIKPIIKQGDFKKYGKSNQLVAKESYKDDTAVGTWHYYHDSIPLLWYTETYANGRVIELHSFYANGKLKRKQIYTNDQSKYDNNITGTCYDETGKEIPFTPFEQMPKAVYDINKYLSGNLKYPARARANNIQGRVVIGFSVDEYGKITNVKVKKGLSPDTDIEALRVVSHMPLWQPGLQDDKPVTVYYNLPIRFTLK